MERGKNVATLPNVEAWPECWSMTMSTDIVERLESHNEFSESGDSRQLRKDAAEIIRQQRHQIAELEALIRRRASEKMGRRSA